MICIPTVNAKRAYVPGVECAPVVNPAYTANGRISKRANAIILQNAGDCDIIIEGGYTLFPKGTLMFGEYNSLNVIKLDTSFSFQPDTSPDPENPVQRLELIEIITSIKGRGYYIDQPDN